MSIDLRQFHASFFSESLEGLAAAETNLLRLESGERSPELLNAIFRAIHSIKGSAGSLGFPEIGRFTHEFEYVLDDLRRGKFEPGGRRRHHARVRGSRPLHAARGPGGEGARSRRYRAARAPYRAARPAARTEAKQSAPKKPAQEPGAAVYRIRFRPGPGFFAAATMR